jgi:lysozyme
VDASDLIRSFEGCDLGAYRDIGGIPTIGWGHTGQDVYMGLVWTQEQADDALTHDVLASQALLAIYSPGLTGGTLEALTDFVFDLGIGRYRTSTLCKYVNAQDWANAKTEILKWDHDNGNVVAGLLRRRQAEAELIQI